MTAARSAYYKKVWTSSFSRLCRSPMAATVPNASLKTSSRKVILGMNSVRTFVKLSRHSSLIGRFQQASACIWCVTKYCRLREDCRNISDQHLAYVLCRRWQYRKAHQVGSHIIVETSEPGHQRLAIPAHNSLRLGTFSSILRTVVEHKHVPRDDP